MGKDLSVLLIFALGSSVVGLSYMFLNPAFKGLSYSPGISYRSVVGIILTWVVVLTATSSIGIAVMVTVIPSIFWTALLSWNLKKRNKRRALITKELPLLLDHLVLQVEAGHSIQQALRSAPGLFITGGPLHTGLRELDESLNVGRPIVQAMEKFGQWLGTSEAEVPIMALSQAIVHGTPLAKVLREQSKRIREHLILNGEQFANTVSVKILIPLLFFIFPASFLVIFSPVIVSFSVRLP